MSRRVRQTQYRLLPKCLRQKKTKIGEIHSNKLQNKAVPIDEKISIQKRRQNKELMNETFISTPRKGEKLLLKTALINTS